MWTARADVVRGASGGCSSRRFTPPIWDSGDGLAADCDQFHESCRVRIPVQVLKRIPVTTLVDREHAASVRYGILEIAHDRNDAATDVSTAYPD
jgi:hypothetical protein